MSDHGDDVSNLFKSFGTDQSQYKEVIRANDAAQAQARWPLFTMVAPEERLAPALLSKSEKNHWSSEQLAGAMPTKAVLPRDADDRMARSLRQIARRFPDANADMPAETIATENPAKPHLFSPAPMMPSKLAETPPSLFAHFGTAEKSVKESGRVPGLFPRNEVTHPVDACPQQAGADFQSNHLLSAIFKRLETVKVAPEAPETVKKPAFLRNLGR